jgi:hypothetical protein
MTVSEIIDRLVAKVEKAVIAEMANGATFSDAKVKVSADLNVTGSAIWGIEQAKLC